MSHLLVVFERSRRYRARIRILTVMRRARGRGTNDRDLLVVRDHSRHCASDESQGKKIAVGAACRRTEKRKAKELVLTRLWVEQRACLHFVSTLVRDAKAEKASKRVFLPALRGGAWGLAKALKPRADGFKKGNKRAIHLAQGQRSSRRNQSLSFPVRSQRNCETRCALKVAWHTLHETFFRSDELLTTATFYAELGVFVPPARFSHVW